MGTRSKEITFSQRRRRRQQQQQQHVGLYCLTIWVAIVAPRPHDAFSFLPPNTSVRIRSPLATGTGTSAFSSLKAAASTSTSTKRAKYSLPQPPSLSCSFRTCTSTQLYSTQSPQDKDDEDQEDKEPPKKKQDVSDLFAAYMSNRADEPLGSSTNANTNTPSSNAAVSSDVTSPTKWWPTPVQRVTKRFLKDDKTKLVQPISLDGSPLTENPGNDDKTNKEGNGEEEVMTVTNNFQALFEGVPKLDSILNGPKESSSTPSSSSSSIGESPTEDDLSFSEESISEEAIGKGLLTPADIEEINTHLQTLRTDMMDKASALWKENPNVDTKFLLNSVLEEQRQILVSQRIELRRMENYKAYYEKQQAAQVPSPNNAMEEETSSGSKVGSSSSIHVDEELVKELLTEVETETDVRQRLSSRIQDFKEYEESLRARHRSQAKKEIPSTHPPPQVDSSRIQTQESGSKTPAIDFDEVQLSVMKDLLFKRQSAAIETDQDDVELDNIENGIEELQELLANKEVMTNYPKPENLKEWQMYRAIATRLNEEKQKVRSVMKSGTEVGEGESDVEDVATITRLLEAWKEFQIKEEQMRKDSGLSIKVRMPFEWDDEENKSQSLPPRRKGPINLEQAEEARSELDDVAVKVMQDLMGKTIDPERKEKIKQELEELKIAMSTRKETFEKLKREGKLVTPKKKIEPITIGSVLNQRNKSSQKNQNVVKDLRGNVDVERNSELIGSESMANRSLQDLDDEEEDEIDIIDSFLIEDKEDNPPPPPKSAFFVDDEELLQDDSLIEVEDTGDDVPTLGTMKEQKFRSLVARSGVRTIEEQNQLQEQWEDYQKVEQAMRDQSGLSGTGVSDGSAQSQETPMPGAAKITYDASKIFTEDGDIDVDKILGSIGKRPTRGNKGKRKETSTQALEYTEVPVVASPSVEKAEKGTIFPEKNEELATLTVDIPDLPQEKVPSIDEDKRSAFPGHQESALEQAERQHLTDSLSGFGKRKNNLLDYTVLSVEQLNSLMELKRSEAATSFSPYMARINKPYSEFGCIFSLEGALVDVLGLQYESWKKVARIYDFNIPSVEDVKYASVHEEEYAVKKIFFWTDDIFATRKIKQTFREIRSDLFQEWLSSKEDETVDKPEPTNDSSGILGFEESSTKTEQTSQDEADVLDLQYIAWRRVAKQRNFEAPAREIVQLAQTLNPDEAVRGVFRWTRDFVLSNDIASDYRTMLREETSTWMMQKGLNSSNSSGISNQETKAVSMNDSDSSGSGPSQGDVIKLKLEAWNKVAREYRFSLPTIDEILVAEFITPDQAINTIFKWPVPDSIEPETIATSFRDELQKVSREWVKENGIVPVRQDTEDQDQEEEFPLVTPKEGALEFLTSLEDVDLPCAVLSNFDGDDVDRIIDLVGLSRFFPTDKRVSASQSYELGEQQLLGCALRLERRPDHCITLSCTPQAAAIAHNIEMKDIAVVGPYPYYELVTADLTVRDLEAINLMNVRNIFSETNIEPMQQLQVEGPKELRKTLLKTRYWDDGDR